MQFLARRCVDAACPRLIGEFLQVRMRGRTGEHRAAPRIVRDHADDPPGGGRVDLGTLRQFVRGSATRSGQQPACRVSKPIPQRFELRVVLWIMLHAAMVAAPRQCWIPAASPSRSRAAMSRRSAVVVGDAVAAWAA